VHWPIFVEGPRFAEAFPHHRHVAVTGDLTSLQNAGFPQALIGVWSNAIPSLNALQVAAVRCS
jgi:helicase